MHDDPFTDNDRRYPHDGRAAERSDGALPGHAGSTPRSLVSKLALVMVQGEQLQHLCSEMDPVLSRIRQDPQLAHNAEMLASALQAAVSVAEAIVVVAEVLAKGLQPPGIDQRVVSPGPRGPRA